MNPYQGARPMMPDEWCDWCGERHDLREDCDINSWDELDNEFKCGSHWMIWLGPIMLVLVLLWLGTIVSP